MSIVESRTYQQPNFFVVLRDLPVENFFMTFKKELLFAMALQRVQGLGDKLVKSLITTVGSSEGVFQESISALSKIDGIGLARAKAIQSKKVLKQAERELKYVESHRIQCLYFMDEDFPPLLKHCSDGPVLLFSKGNINFNNPRVVSVVGTRRITSYGQSFTEKFIKELSTANPIIVSGFAYGIDISAQKEAIKYQLQTISCLAHGFDTIYPKTHQRYMKAIEENGGFLTEYWSDDPFHRNNFLRRNRIIAGISQATVVIESAEKGGSLVTADIANSYNRDVFAVPGRIDDMQSMGCNNLIKTQQAQLLTSAAELIYLMGWNTSEKLPATQQLNLFTDLSEEQKKIVELLKQRSSEHLDSIALDCELSVAQASSQLLQLELKGIVNPLPGKQFKLC